MQYQISELQIQNHVKYILSVINSDYKKSSRILKSSKDNLQQQIKKRPTEEKHYMVILDHDKEDVSDLCT